MSDLNDWNAKIIEEFRANGGKVAGQFEGAPMLLLRTIGAKTGLERVNPMMYLEQAGRVFVFASKAGADTDGFAEYQAKTTRVIPVVELIRS